MTETNMNNLEVGDFSSYGSDWEVDEQTTDGITEQKETTYIISDWEKKFGYYKQIPELAVAIDAKATWTIGKGFQSEEITEMLLSTINGAGVDTFNTIMENMIRTYHIAGDAYCEIIRKKDGQLINLKPLDPSSIRIVANRQGRIIRYEQLTKINETKMKKKIDVEDMFHLSRNRVADEIHGQSVITPVENIIKMRNEAMDDWKRVLHRNIDPLWIFHLDTDDPSTISEFKNKMDRARGQGENNMYIPKGAVVPELISTATNATLNPQTWIENLNRYFFQSCGTPGIIIGNSGSMTESAAKMEYLVWQQTIEEEQLYIEEQVLAQLNIVINLEFPARLENEMLSNKPRENQQPQVNPPQLQQNESANEANDTTAEVEGNK
jgi:hypothetical protein